LRQLSFALKLCCGIPKTLTVQCSVQNLTSQKQLLRPRLIRTLIAALALTLIGCGNGRPPVVAQRLPNPIISRQTEVLDPQLLAEVIGEGEGAAYRVGPGDILVVAVYGHPELSIATYAGGVASQNTRLAGLVIDTDGTIQFPLIGSVQVSGKTSDQLRQYLEVQLAAYVKEPKVTVQVAFAGNIRYYLLGQFTSPGLKYSDRPLHLLEALTLGGSIQLDQASLRSAYVARKGRRLPVNFQRLLMQGELTQNIPLRPGDVVVVPDKETEQAFVFAGAASGAPRGGAVPFIHGRLNLLQALAAVGYGWRERFQGKWSDTRVIRTEGDRAELFIVDAGAIFDGKAAPFELAPGDVVYVPPTALTNWNQALEQVLPSLQTISGILNPFVQIKYLSEP
jgi:polysaccharide biosynthesis/export protein